MTAATLTLSEFLLARFAEDEAVARDQLRAYQHVFGIPHYFRIDRSIVGLTPRTALAECEAKRRIVDLHSGMHDCRFFRGRTDCATVTFLAQPYADHPDYRPEWRPM